MGEYCFNPESCSDLEHCSHTSEGEVNPHVWDEEGCCLFCPWRKHQIERKKAQKE